MSARLFLHIGANKTGSSAIQRFLNQNREVLSLHGLLYPITSCAGNAHYKLSDELGFAYGKGVVDLSSPRIVELQDSLFGEIESSGPSDVVISSEAFVLPKSVEVVKEFFKGFDVRVVVYVRRHDRWWPSAYNQAVKTVTNPPWGKGFGSYMKYQRRLGPCSSRGAYRMLVDRWSSVFGKKNIIVRPYESQQNQPNLMVDFLNAIGRQDVVGELSMPDDFRVNESVSAKAMAFVEAFQRANIDQGLRAKLIDRVLMWKSEAGNCGFVDPAMLVRLVEQNSKEYEYLAREYLGRADGKLFYDPLPDPSSSWMKIKQPSPSEIVELVANVLMEDMDSSTCDRKTA